jgi:hypothetical protein
MATRPDASLTTTTPLATDIVLAANRAPLDALSSGARRFVITRGDRTSFDIGMRVLAYER